MGKIVPPLCYRDRIYSIIFTGLCSLHRHGGRIKVQRYGGKEWTGLQENLIGLAIVSSSAANVQGSWHTANRWLGRNDFATKTGTTGEGPFLVSAIRRENSSSSV